MSNVSYRFLCRMQWPAPACCTPTLDQGAQHEAWYIGSGVRKTWLLQTANEEICGMLNCAAAGELE